MSVNEIMNTAVGSFSLGSILSAIVTLLICLLVIRIILRVVTRLLEKSKLEDRVRKYIVSGIRAILYVIAALIVASALGVDMTSLVALVSVCSLGVTLAAEDILSNVAGGLVIMSSHPFKTGDFVEVGGVSGSVLEIGLNHTKLSTPDGLTAMIPNKEMASSKIINYTTLGRRRVTRKVTASYGAPTETVKAACHQALAQTEGILVDPAPAVYLSNYGESSIEYTIFCWCDESDYWAVYFGLGEALRDSFAAKGVEMTYDHLNVHIVEK